MFLRTQVLSVILPNEKLQELDISVDPEYETIDMSININMIAYCSDDLDNGGTYITLTNGQTIASIETFNIIYEKIKSARLFSFN